MRTTLTIGCWMIMIAALSGCAGPRYQTVYRYEAPTDAAGRACLARCEPKLAACQTGCQGKYQTCLKAIEPTVEARYSDALKRYETELERYRHELDFYQLRSSLGWGYHSMGYGPWPYYYTPWPDPYYFAPTPPDKPSHDKLFKQVRQEKCENDCGCQPIYDACFLTCGGKKIPEVQCIAHCPKDK